tara:strand:+ start:104815 stop:105015 length:201 start_codon:yes stop_codon:yes gene_type:complete
MIDMMIASFYNIGMNLYNEVVNAIKIVKDGRESFLIRGLTHEELIKIKKLLDDQLKDSVLAMEDKQ